MKLMITILLEWFLILFSQPVWANEVDYTSREYDAIPCELFARDAYQASDNLSHGVALQDLLEFIENAPVSDNEKQRAFQAIQFVWKNQLDNSQMAYALAMGICLKPKKEMAPLSEPWITSPRTSREYF
ncbi:MAG: hypothetical protein V3R68_05450 [Gammaproteobacteria bacterium]